MNGYFYCYWTFSMLQKKIALKKKKLALKKEKNAKSQAITIPIFHSALIGTVLKCYKHDIRLKDATLKCVTGIVANIDNNKCFNKAKYSRCPEHSECFVELWWPSRLLNYVRNALGLTSLKGKEPWASSKGKNRATTTWRKQSRQGKNQDTGEKRNMVATRAKAIIIKYN